MSKEKEQDFSEIVHPDLLAAQKFAYEPNGLSIDKLKREAESQEYGAFEFEMNNLRIKFRVAKITPTKIGQFVTLWKRIGTGPIQPYDRADPVDLFVISVRRGERFGQFVFPKEVLCEKDIVSKEGNGGKRAMRVYPPWDIPDNRQAEKTQKWQLLYFFEIRPGQYVDTLQIQKLFLAKL
ncbi:MAG: MepB family protein [Chlamydiae bacterium]|nr:MepB family protein [Chlamydiota bacterium]